MMKKIKAIIWLRLQQYVVSKVTLIQLAIPFVMAYIFDNFIETGEGETNQMILSMCLTMAFLFTAAQPLTTTIAEEKEKNNLKSMQLAGVSEKEYLVASLFFPLVFTALSMIILPLLLQVPVTNYLLPYTVVGFLTAVAIILIHLALGLYSQTQAQAQALSFPLLMIIQFFSMFAETNETIANIVDYSMIGSYTSFFEDPLRYSWQSSTFYFLLAWIALLLIANVLLLQGKTDKRKRTFTILYRLKKLVTSYERTIKEKGGI
ncbi:ABC transporter permease [Enterococcus innesii]|uniref:ABC transporter permease n=1 Tax=Enterococcus innesii TaxID=2839759 RepID=UPI003984984D